MEAASSDVRILRNIAWPQEVKDEFFRNKSEKLPVVEYDQYDPSAVLEQVKKIRELTRETNPVNDWANRIANCIENSALMLSSRGTRDFYKYSRILYGDPMQALPRNTMDLAQHFDRIFRHVKNMELGEPPEMCILASSLAEDMQNAVQEMFGEHAPEVVMDPDMPSKAIAGRRRIRIRPSACFSDKDVNQLIEHEAAIHVGTSINGNLQPYIKILGENHAGNTPFSQNISQDI